MTARRKSEGLDPAKLKKEFKAKAIILNDRAPFSHGSQFPGQPAEVATFGDLKLRHLANVQISGDLAARPQNPYAENHVKRKTEYVFRKGRTIYELVSR